MVWLRLAIICGLLPALTGGGAAMAQRRPGLHRPIPPYWLRPHYPHRVRTPAAPAPLDVNPYDEEIIIPRGGAAVGPSPSLPGGMMITVTKNLSDRPARQNGQEDGAAAENKPIDRPKQAAEQLASCWSPPLPERGETVEISIRFAFNRQGGVQGAPRITYVKAGQGVSADAVRQSIAAAIKACTPLHFATSMAESMPGYPLSVRFIGQRAQNGG